jgi:hypothetical protein
MFSNPLLQNHCRLIRCYSTDNPMLRFVTVGTQQFPLYLFPWKYLSKHVTLPPSKGCLSPNSLKFVPFFHFRGVLFAMSAFGLTSIVSAPFFSGARPEHLCGPAFFVPLFHIHSLLSFLPHSLTLGRPVLLPPVPPIQAVSLFPFWRRSTPPQSPILGLGSAGNLYCLLLDI